MTFIVRISVDEAGGVTGIVERAQTGQKTRFEGTEAIGALIARMMAGRDAGPGRSGTTEESQGRP
jgi:hypothetical protein